MLDFYLLLIQKIKSKKLRFLVSCVFTNHSQMKVLKITTCCLVQSKQKECVRNLNIVCFNLSFFSTTITTTSTNTTTRKGLNLLRPKKEPFLYLSSRNHFGFQKYVKTQTIQFFKQDKLLAINLLFQKQLYLCLILCRSSIVICLTVYL